MTTDTLEKINFIHELTVFGSEFTICGLNRNEGIMVSAYPNMATCPKCKAGELWEKN